MQQSHRFVLVDVFTDTPLAGNPLAVFTDARGMSEGTMLALTREFHFSECVFLLPATEKGAQATLRIFTPQGEVPFAGHPVLGAAFVLGTTVQLDAVTFQTGRGAVPVSLEREGARVVFRLDASTAAHDTNPTFGGRGGARRGVGHQGAKLGDHAL